MKTFIDKLESIYDELGFTKKQTDMSIRINPEMLNVDIDKFAESYDFFNKKLYINKFNIKRIMFSHPNLLFLGKENLEKLTSETFAFLKRHTNIPSYKFSRAIIQNPRLLTRSTEVNESWLNKLKSDLKLSNECIIHLYTHAHDFQPVPRKMDNKIKEMKLVIEFLHTLGFSDKEISNNSPVILLSVSQLNKRFKLALLHGISPKDFIEFCYKIPEDVVYSRFEAIKNGVIDENLSPYSQKELFDRSCEFSTEELTSLFPLNDNVKNKLYLSFMEQYPTLAEKINEFYLANFNYTKNTEIDNFMDEFEEMFLLDSEETNE